VMSTGIEIARVHPGALDMDERLIPFFPPVDTARFQPDSEKRTAARAELAVPDDAPLAGMVGNINPQKGHEYFVRAAALIQRTYPDAYFRILGAHTPTQVAYETKVRAEAEAAGLTQDDRLQWTDPGARVAELLPAFDLFLLTSVPRSEGVPTVVLEAMSCGIPVVATDVGAVREVVEDGVTGFVVPPLDPAAIARATLRLLQDPDLRRRMGEEGRRRAVQRYDVQVCADTHVRAFQAAIEHHRARPSVRPRASTALPKRQTAAADLRSLLVCPACHGPLDWSAEETRCTACPRAYPIEDGIPILLLDRAAAEHDELEHLHGHAHEHERGNGHSSRERQVAYFDHHAAAEFETTRPHGTPALYR
ncbi:MAG: glycosyltransferase, partial [Dehalococcoidia bacterium]